MAIATLPQTATGLQSVQDLYDMINGKTTTTSGGTTTTNEGISQESMNAMLSNALASTNGLAAVSQGQRSAGGYGSSVNQMLTNDLLARTAGQIAASQKTTTTTKSPTETTVGGATVGGVAKTAGFLAALNQLGDTGITAKKLFGIGNKDPEQLSSANSVTAVANSIGSSVDARGGYGDYAAMDNNSGGISSIANSIGDSVDARGGYGDFSLPDFSSVSDSGGGGEALMTGTDDNAGKSADDSDIWNFADGGLVSKKAPKVLGTNQFNTVIDPRESLAGTVEMSENATPQGQTVSSNETPETSTQTSSSSSNVNGGGGGEKVDTSGNITVTPQADSGQSPVTRVVNDVVSGSVDKQDLGTISSGLGMLGKVTGNSDVSNLAKVVGIGGSGSLTEAGMRIGDIATKGALGQALNIYKTVRNPILGNVVDTVASFNPATAVANKLLNLAGLGSLGDIAGNIGDMIAPNNPMSAAQQTAMTTAAADHEAALNAQYNAANSNDTTTPEGTLRSGGSTYYPGAYNGDPITGAPDTGTIGGHTEDSTTGTTSMANGGEVSGPGTSVSDSIHAHLSDGEYVLSADTVKAIGVENLDALQEKYHTPAAVQKLMKMGKVR